MSHAWIEGIAILPLACPALACSAHRTTVSEGEPAKPVALAAGAYQVGADRFACRQP